MLAESAVQKFPFIWSLAMSDESKDADVIPGTIRAALTHGSSVIISGPSYTVAQVRAMIALARNTRARITITQAARYPETDMELISSEGREVLTWEFSR
jgi:hypothetical protein